MTMLLTRAYRAIALNLRAIALDLRAVALDLRAIALDFTSTSLDQIASITWFGLCTLPRRKGAAVAAAFGIAGLVPAVVGVLSLAQGIRRPESSGGSTVSARGWCAATELWNDTRVLHDSYQRGPSYQSHSSRVVPGDKFQEYDDPLAPSAPLKEKVVRHTQSYAGQSTHKTNI